MCLKLNHKGTYGHKWYPPNSTYHPAWKCNMSVTFTSAAKILSAITERAHKSLMWHIPAKCDKQNISFILIATGGLETRPTCSLSIIPLNSIRWSNFPRSIWICLDQTHRTSKLAEPDISSGQRSLPKSRPVAHGVLKGWLRAVSQTDCAVICISGCFHW
jgi:hypothetical protein